MAGIWYATTAIHLWRFYFCFRNADPEKMTPANRENWKACDRAIKSFSETETGYLQTYYTTGFGGYEDMKAVSDLAERTGLMKSSIWDVVKHANYLAIVERGLMDRRDKPAKRQEESA